MTAPTMQLYEEVPQEIAIEVSGPDVLLFASNRPADDDAPDDAIPDPVQLFVEGINQQMFPRLTERRCRSSAWILARSADPSQGRQSWHLRIEDANPAALRVLVNLMMARDLLSVALRGSSVSPEGRRLDALGTAYPLARPHLPFVVEREEAIRSLRDRFIQVELASPPTDQQFDGLSAAMELWSNIMLFGGYPPEGMDPRESGVMPDGPLLLDETTVQIAFPEAFHADEAAFNCMLNHLYCFKQAGGPVAAVRIR